MKVTREGTISNDFAEALQKLAGPSVQMPVSTSTPQPNPSVTIPIAPQSGKEINTELEMAKKQLEAASNEWSKARELYKTDNHPAVLEAKARMDHFSQEVKRLDENYTGNLIQQTTTQMQGEGTLDPLKKMLGV